MFLRFFLHFSSFLFIFHNVSSFLFIYLQFSSFLRSEDSEGTTNRACNTGRDNKKGDKLNTWMTRKHSFPWMMQTAVERWSVNESHEHALSLCSVTSRDTQRAPFPHPYHNQRVGCLVFHRQRVKQHQKKLGWNNTSAQQTAKVILTAWRHVLSQQTFVSGLDHCYELVTQRRVTIEEWPIWGWLRFHVSFFSFFFLLRKMFLLFLFSCISCKIFAAASICTGV